MSTSTRTVVSSTPISDPHSFWLEARYQRGCAHCGATGDFHAHHVVDKQTLRRAGLPLHDTRNALRLCHRCHMQFEWAGPGKVQVVIADLTQQNLCYIWAVMGAAGAMYLAREYDGYDDERWLRHVHGGCDECQLPA